MTAALAPIVAVLERAIGMAVGSVGPRAVEAAVRRRLDATGVPDLAAYLDRLRADRQEQAELVDAVIVPETWFFRYPDSFRHLATWAVTRPEKPNPLRPLRVLCVPCCTGEEPYSAAAALVDAGLPADAVRVDGVDVSRRLVEYAAAGVYGEPAFRETPADVRGRHFAPAGGGTFAVRPAVKAAVRFRAGNLADPKLLAGEPAYHAVFCRNLFIYLTDAARRTAVATLDRLLAPDGVIYMGHAEPLGLMDARFRSVGPPQAFAFTRTPVEASGGRQPPVPPVVVDSSRNRGLTPPARPAAVPDPPPPPRPTPPPADPLAAARAAADAGRAADAAELCRRFLADHPPTADAFALLGVAELMAGDAAAAERAFTRALYLDPRHFDALIHMLALAERRGDAAGAANYRRRAARREVPA